MGNAAGPVYYEITTMDYWYKRANGSLAGPFESRMEAEVMQSEEEAPQTGLQFQPRAHDE